MSKPVKMPSIAYVVARSHPQHVIGCENKLPWRLRTDLRFFRSVTEGHAVVMGRRTFDSIGHPLRNRMNIVVSRQDGNDGNELKWVKNREAALFFADIYSIINERNQLMIIGGAEIYKVFADLVNKVFLTQVFGHFDDGDAFFDEKFDGRKWKTLEERDYPRSQDDDFPFRISILERRLKSVRQRELTDFLVSDFRISDWLKQQVVEKVPSFERLPEEQFELPIPQRA
ncbi:dihydrofolate reductase [Enterovirga aerilata]|uniref:dihydrofolate reductase n=1 Tax=Enterovirga aerilata TaxID=2730920 RepID=A0A849I1I8_9HYPH|nr:dihydrofolate reductase [Enterovirga sp. DB1703]NNM71454.1 dihydrofolate reductase [Enterovirga sp. DB1703]